MTIIVFAPHPDDEVLGVGGTLARYAEAGERTVVVVFSTGRSSHPLHKERVIVQTRKEETMAAHKELGVSETVFLDLEDTRLREEIIEKETILHMHDLIKKERPKKLFIPAIDDLHPDHRAVTRAVLQLYSQYSLTMPVYTYINWNPVPIFKRAQPRLVVDITGTNRKKLSAIKAYRSQWVSMYQLVPVVLIKTFFAGLRHGTRWAEVFPQVR
jgi:LmbE family N-acetylglucosaminyl deacetylase